MNMILGCQSTPVSTRSRGFQIDGGAIEQQLRDPIQLLSCLGVFRVLSDINGMDQSGSTQAV